MPDADQRLRHVVLLLIDEEQEISSTVPPVGFYDQQGSAGG